MDRYPTPHQGLGDVLSLRHIGRLQCRHGLFYMAFLAILSAALSCSTSTAMAVEHAASGNLIAAVPFLAPEDSEDRNDTKTQLEDALRALKTTKQLGRVEAERALASIDAFRDARTNRKPPQPLSGGLALCLDAPTPECLLQEAFAHAYRVADEGRRDWALSSIATAYFEIGAHDRVYAVVANMDDPRNALRLLEQTVGSENQVSLVGSSDGDTPDEEDPAANASWIASVEAGDWPSARLEIDQIAEPRYRAVALARFSRKAIAAGRTSLAEDALRSCEETIAAIEFAYARSYARYEASLTHIALVESTEGGETETEAAMNAAGRIEQPHFRADAFWRLASVSPATRVTDIQDRAEQSFSKIVSRLRQVFVLTGDANKSAQRRSRAIAIASSINDPLDRARAFTRLARYIR